MKNNILDNFCNNFILNSDFILKNIFIILTIIFSIISLLGGKKLKFFCIFFSNIFILILHIFLTSKELSIFHIFISNKINISNALLCKIKNSYYVSVSNIFSTLEKYTSSTKYKNLFNEYKEEYENIASIESARINEELNSYYEIEKDIIDLIKKIHLKKDYINTEEFYKSFDMLLKINSNNKLKEFILNIPFFKKIIYIIDSIDNIYINLSNYYKSSYLDEVHKEEFISKIKLNNNIDDSLKNIIIPIINHSDFPMGFFFNLNKIIKFFKEDKFVSLGYLFELELWIFFIILRTIIRITLYNPLVNIIFLVIYIIVAKILFDIKIVI